MEFKNKKLIKLIGNSQNNFKALISDPNNLELKEVNVLNEVCDTSSTSSYSDLSTQKSLTVRKYLLSKKKFLDKMNTYVIKMRSELTNSEMLNLNGKIEQKYFSSSKGKYWSDENEAIINKVIKDEKNLSKQFSIKELKESYFKNKKFSESELYLRLQIKRNKDNEKIS